jgi:LuxR family maltose regulon positive regulatory protein
MSTDPENHSTEKLLQTKLEIPSITARVLRRNRLTSLFERPGESKITILTAPAGYGKTTLLGDWLSISSAPHHRTVWVTLDIFDNAPFRFWSYLISGLRRSIPTLKFNTDSLLVRGFDPSNIANLIPLINEIDNLPLSLKIILDDFNVISDAQINTSISYLIDHQPKNLHLVISSRTHVDIPLARLRTLGRLVEIASDDLAFSFEETRKYLGDMIKRQLTAHEIVEIYENTEGWIAGLQMTAITHETRRNLESRHYLGSYENTAFSEYFSEEVLLTHNPAVQEFLIKTSLLGEFSAGLCDFLLERMDSQKLIDELISKNLFIEPIDSQGTWFRYHPLFARSLTQQLQRKDPTGAVLLHTRALKWFLEKGFPEKAVVHALQSGHEEVAAEIIETIAMNAILNFDLIKLVHWINAIPDSLLTLRPRLGIYNALACFLLGQNDMSQVNLTKVDAVLESSSVAIYNPHEYQTLKWEISAVRTGIDCFTGNQVRGVENGSCLLQDKSREDNYLYAMLTHCVGIGLENQGMLKRALAAYEIARNYGLAHNYFYGYFHSSVAIAQVSRKQGKLNEAKKEFDNALGFAIELNLENATVTLAQTGLLEISLQQNNMAMADRLATEILTNFDRTIFSESVWINHVERCVFLANYFVRKNDLKNAHNYFDRALNRYQDYSIAGSAWPYDIVDTYLRIIRAEARKNNVKVWFPLADGFLNPLTLATPAGRIMQASIYMNQGKYLAAKDLLNNLVEELRQSDFGGHLVQVLVLYALTLYATSDKESAFDVIEETLQIGSSTGYVRVFLEESEQFKSLLCEFAGSAKSSEFEKNNPGFLENLTRMLAFDCSQMADKTSTNELVMTTLHLLREPLSERENEVLNLVLNGRSAKEISEILMVSINTAKTHIKNIYRKFGVHSQKMLFERVTELGFKN